MNESWKSEFDEKTPDYWDLLDKMKEIEVYSWLEENKEHLYKNRMYPENPFELDIDKIKSFISSLLQKEREMIAEKLMKEIPKEKTGGVIPSVERVEDLIVALKEKEIQGFNSCLSQVKEIINQVLKEE